MTTSPTSDVAATVAELRSNAVVVAPLGHHSGEGRWNAAESLRRAADLIEHQAKALSEAEAANSRLRQVVADSAAAIGNGAGLSPESSLDFIEILPSEIAAYTTKLRRFLKCSRDEGTEALDRALAAEKERDELQRTFDLRWKADMRAIKRWQAAHPDRGQIWPDHADKVVWLLERHDAIEARLAEAMKAIEPFALMADCSDFKDSAAFCAALAFVNAEKGKA